MCSVMLFLLRQLQRSLIPAEPQLDVTVCLKTYKVNPGFLSTVMVSFSIQKTSLSPLAVAAVRLHSLHLYSRPAFLNLISLEIQEGRMVDGFFPPALSCPRS